MKRAICLLPLLLLTGCPSADGDLDLTNPTVVAALTVAADDHVLGSASAPITVIEYADFQCPFCGKFARETFPTIKQEYVDTGKVRWVFRHFPLRSIHACAEDSARGSECAADQGKFFEFHDDLFATQTGLCNADLANHATAVGLDAMTFSGCISAGSKADRVQRDFDSGVVLGVPGTPCFFVNNRRVAGFLTLDEMRAELDR